MREQHWRHTINCLFRLVVNKQSVGWAVVVAQLGKAVAADPRDPRVESHHRQNFMMYNQNIEKD